ncbi:MAG: DUF2182 domain-containing protein [Steroidobacter sp.]
MITIDSLLRRERAVVAVCLAALTVLAWMYIWRGAGMGMTASQMTRLALFPHTQPELMVGMSMPRITWVTIVAMWWVMMIAMMTPSAAPFVLLYGRVVRHANAQQSRAAVYAPSLFLAAGYLVAWLAFACVATSIQYVLERGGLISSMMLWSQSAWLSAALLIGAGAYQLSPFKYRCLHHCRSPIHFLQHHWRPGRSGAFAMGLEHGAWCVGCCWMLMALLFVGGVMNLVWIALLTLLVLAERVIAGGVKASRATGAVLVMWGLVTLAM